MRSPGSTVAAGVSRPPSHAADDTCLRPGCDGDVHDLDHLRPYAHGGASTADNVEGVCRPDNLVKEMRGWTVSPVVGGTPARIEGRLVDGVQWRTPTGHRYTSRRSRPGGGRAPERLVPRTPRHASGSPLEDHLRHLVGRLRQ
ncbi:HNH endonuclease signature motif containing protein [Mumia sp. DW29H23]|uniref:HNH endonuclease signature motif containing protein n=1 Tax=Mumia sp. DW29H23 TaxID=3421241 RepID=UPI003D6983B2